MIYWGLSKLLRSPRQKFHRYSEVFIEKSIDKMLSENKVDQPVEVFD
jgi:hypothetical protein